MDRESNREGLTTLVIVSVAKGNSNRDFYTAFQSSLLQ